MQWPKDDDIFKLTSVENFKLAGEKTLKTLQIEIINNVKTITDNDRKIELMQLYHNDPLFGGHTGQKKLYAKIRGLYYWKNMQKDVANFVNSCEKCKTNKPKNKIKMPMMITPTPQKPFDTVIIDTVGPLPNYHYQIMATYIYLQWYAISLNI